jgi:hypothetical protein
MNSVGDHPQGAGFPHSEIHGSKVARTSPWLIAACYVLHRLSVPRHPPDALITLIATGPCGRRPSSNSVTRRDKPCYDERATHRGQAPSTGLTQNRYRPYFRTVNLKTQNCVDHRPSPGSEEPANKTHESHRPFGSHISTMRNSQQIARLEPRFEVGPTELDRSLIIPAPRWAAIHTH